jgi:hypothetical protein
MNPDFSFTYSIPYYIIALFVFCLFLINQRKYIKFSTIRFALILVLLLFIGFRGFVYSDWFVYYRIYESLPTIFEQINLDSEEFRFLDKGFLFYSVIIKSFYNNYFFWVFINSLIDILLIDYAFRKFSNNYFLSFFCFIVFNGLFIEFNLLRNSKSILIFFCTIKYLKDGKPIQFFLLNFIGVFFHLSALIYLPLYFFIRKKPSKYLIWILFIISNIIFIFGIKWISFIIGGSLFTIFSESTIEKLTFYQETDLSAAFSFGYFERQISFIILFIMFLKLDFKDKLNIIFYNIYLLYYVVIMCFSEMKTFHERFSVLFIFSYWILFPNLFLAMNNKIKKILLITYILFIAIFRIYKSNNNILCKYDNLLFGIESYQDRNSKFIDFASKVSY